MNKAVLLAGAAVIGLSLLGGAAFAQSAGQSTVGTSSAMDRGDAAMLSNGHRASKIIGSSVVNDANESIGKIDDLLVTADGKAPYAVLSVGGFLGVGSRLVAVPYNNIKIGDDQVTFPAATKDKLNSMPEFHYSK